MINFLLSAIPPEGPGGWITEATATAVLGYFCWAFMTGRLRTEKELNRVIEERDRAVDLVYKNAEIAAGAVDALQRQSAERK